MPVDKFFLVSPRTPLPRRYATQSTCGRCTKKPHISTPPTGARSSGLLGPSAPKNAAWICGFFVVLKSFYRAKKKIREKQILSKSKVAIFDAPLHHLDDAAFYQSDQHNQNAIWVEIRLFFPKIEISVRFWLSKIERKFSSTAFLK